MAKASLVLLCHGVSTLRFTQIHEQQRTNKEVEKFLLLEGDSPIAASPCMPLCLHQRAVYGGGLRWEMSNVSMIDQERLQVKSFLPLERDTSSGAASCKPPLQGPREVLEGKWTGKILGAAKAEVWKVWTTAGADMVASPYAVMALGAAMRTERGCAVALTASEIPEFPDSPGFSEEANQENTSFPAQAPGCCQQRWPM